jgi:hypothetical protein
MIWITSRFSRARLLFEHWNREVTAAYEPTADQRALVENASAFGLPQSEIANGLKIDEKTLRKHFREELDGGMFKLDMIAGGTIAALLKSNDERVRLETAKYYTCVRNARPRR